MPERLPARSSIQKNDSRPAKLGPKSFEQSCGRTKSSHSSSTTMSPYTDNFFAKLAKTVSTTFPYEAFAKENDCEVGDVVHAIKSTIVGPLSKPSIQKRSEPTPLKSAKMTQATGCKEGGSWKSQADVPVTENKSVGLHLTTLVQNSSRLRPMKAIEATDVTSSTKDNHCKIHENASSNENSTAGLAFQTIQEGSIQSTVQDVGATQASELGKRVHLLGQDEATQKDIGMDSQSETQDIIKSSDLAESTENKQATKPAKKREISETLTSDPMVPQTPCYRRSAKKRKTMVPVERQLGRLDVYENYVPVEPKKSTIRLIHDR